MYNLYVRDDDGDMLAYALNLTLDEALRQSEDLLACHAYPEVSIAEAEYD